MTHDEVVSAYQETIDRLTERLESANGMNERLIDDGCKMRHNVEELRGQRDNAEDLYRIKHDECETIHADNQDMRRERGQVTATLQRWVDRYERQGRELGQVTEDSQQKSAIINRQAAKISELTQINATRLNVIDALNAQLDTDWVNDTTVQELETQGLEIGAQVQVLMQQLHNIRMMR